MLSLTLRQAVSKLKDGSISVKDLCENCIKRAIKTRELNSFITETHDVTRQQAQNSAEKWSQFIAGKTQGWRKLEGIPFAIKDNFCTKGIRTSCASCMLESYVPPYTATVVRKLQEEGASVIGKTNMDEYAMGSGSVDSIYGPVKNPWKYKFSSKSATEPHCSSSISGSKDTHSSGDQSCKLNNKSEVCGDWYVAGGSSGGAAVAVATGTCFGALGSDTGGSTRNPASYCGVVGLKPTYGLLSRHGLIPLVNSLDVPGILAKSVGDAAYILNILAGHDEFDSTTVSGTPDLQPTLPDDIDIKRFHIGIPKEYHAPGLSADVLAAWATAADMFENAGAKVTQVSLPHTPYSIICYQVLCCAEVASNMARYDGVEFGHRSKEDYSTEELYATSRHEGFNDVVRGRILAGNYFLLRSNYEQIFLKAQKVRRLITKDFKDVFSSGIDVLLTPTTLTTAPQFNLFTQVDNRTQSSEQDVFTQPVNMAGVPAVSVPGGLSAEGLPIGLQFISNNFCDQKLLIVAKWYENQIGFQRLNLDHLHS